MDLQYKTGHRDGGSELKDNALKVIKVLGDTNDSVVTQNGDSNLGGAL